MGIIMYNEFDAVNDGRSTTGRDEWGSGKNNWTHLSFAKIKNWVQIVIGLS